MTDLWQRVSFENNPIKRIEVPVKTPIQIQSQPAQQVQRVQPTQLAQPVQQVRTAQTTPTNRPKISRQEFERIMKHREMIRRKRELMQGTYNKEIDKRRIGKARLKAIARRNRAYRLMKKRISRE